MEWSEGHTRTHVRTRGSDRTLTHTCAIACAGAWVARSKGGELEGLLVGYFCHLRNIDCGHARRKELLVNWRTERKWNSDESVSKRFRCLQQKKHDQGPFGGGGDGGTPVGQAGALHEGALLRLHSIVGHVGTVRDGTEEYGTGHLRTYLCSKRCCAGQGKQRG